MVYITSFAILDQKSVSPLSRSAVYIYTHPDVGTFNNIARAHPDVRTFNNIDRAHTHGQVN